MSSLVTGCGDGNAHSEPDGQAAPGRGEPFELPPSPAPWTVTMNGFDCHHPPVEPDCADGWCEIPPGCFVMGSPVGEPNRGEQTEIETPTVLTHGFVIQQTELTQAQWLELVDRNPSGITNEPNGKQLRDCLRPDCPVGRVNWYDAVEYANRLSAREGYERCYALTGCTGTVGGGEEDPFICQLVEHTNDSIYECRGYRLPTEPEHEYAARAGTRTAFYSGDLTEEWARECDRVLPHLDAIAWYCANSERETRPVAGKEANHWGLYDMLGNAYEWSNVRPVMPSPGAPPHIDPQAGTGNDVPQGDAHLTEGGVIWAAPSRLRAAARGNLNSASAASTFGFRLVRSLPK